MKRLKNAMIAVVAFMAGACFADTPQIKNVKAFQQYPWSNKVYISYEVVGDLGNVDDIWFLANDKAKGKVYSACAGESYLSGDTSKKEGLHKVVWDMESQGITINSSKVEFSIFYYSNSDLQMDDKYMVIDLSDGANATSYPVVYMAKAPSGGFNTDVYKTTKLVLRCILPGPFRMIGEHSVLLTKPYYMGIFEVTQKQYELVMGSNPSNCKGDMRPVEMVSYNKIRGASEGSKWPLSSAVDSTSFMGKLRSRTGLDFDLPTEAQWEYACRAGTKSSYNNGGDSVSDLKRLGRYDGTQFDGKGGYYDHTTVGSYQPNAWGLYDMHGNVWEWCLDWYGDLSSATDPSGSSSGSSRVLRGGGWCSQTGCTSSSRIGLGPQYGENDWGFRLARTLSE